MAARKPGRFVAPVALVAAAVAVGVIIQSHTGSHRAAPPPPPTRQHQAQAATHHTVVTKPTFYVVKPGDSLSTISVRTKVSIAELQALNPGVNPAALQTGQRLRLSR